jgi:hypothetical protein
MFKVARFVVAMAMVVAFGYSTAQAGSGFGDPNWAGVWPKAKAKKVQGDMVQAYTYSSGLNVPAQTSSTKCTFLQSGKFKVQTDKDVSIQLQGVTCDPNQAVPFTGELCAHTKAISTVAKVTIDKDGVETTQTCVSGGGDLAGKTNYASGQVGTISCTDGKCKGTLGAVTEDPCPTVPKISQLVAVEVFDGPYLVDAPVSGSHLKSCCGPGQMVADSISASLFAPCSTSPGSEQEPMAEMGTLMIPKP